MSSRGRYPCFLYNFILRIGSRLLFLGKPKKVPGPYPLLDKYSYVSSFPKQLQVSEIVLSLISCSQLLSNVSRIAALVPATNILSMTVQYHVINGCGQW